MKSDLDLAQALVIKAGNDLKMAEIGLEHAAPLDTVAFHLQQTAEKMIKALLASRAIDYPRTHDLAALLDLALNDFPTLGSFRERLLPLSSYAVDMRYDIALDPSRDEVSLALETVRELLREIMDLLPPDARP